VYLNLRMGKRPQRRRAQPAGGQTPCWRRKAHVSPLIAARHVGVTLQIDEGHEVFDAKHSNLHPLFARSPDLTMLDTATIHALARQLYERASRARRCATFSKQHPGMTIDDGYAIQRAWVRWNWPTAAPSRAARSA
jgi:hypothetical protein